MKKLSTCFALMAALGLQAQITVTNATFPAAGDTLKYATDLNPDGVTITPAGPSASTWNFSELAPTFRFENVFQAAAAGSAAASFPTADLVTIAAGGQSENFYNLETNGFYNLGFFGTDPTAALPVPTTFYFDPPVPERRAPMAFFDINQAGSELNIAFSLDDLGPLADSLGPLAGFADSIRIRGVATRLDVVDAYGSLTIPGGTYDVIREKRTEYRDTRLDIHSLLGWTDITDLIPTGGFGDGLGKDTVVTYLFFSNTEKEIIAEINAGSDGLVPQSVTYKDNGVVSAVGEILPANQVLVSPNPASENALFTVKGFAAGDYFVRLFDARGQMVLVEKLAKGNGNVDLTGMSGGPYFYQVYNEKNKAVASGVLLKIND